MNTDNATDAPSLPAARVDRLATPIQRFLHTEASSGFVLIAATIVALVVANSPLGPDFEAFWSTPVGLSIGGGEWVHSLRHWVNDGLVTLFFFVVGLEIKRELASGELSEPSARTLPLAAALGGMAVPALIYLALASGPQSAEGWGVVMATDIAFVVGCLALLGERIPRSLRVFVLSLAIIDDIGAILVIAVGYSKEFHLVPFLLAIAGLGVVGLLRWLGVRSVLAYWLVGFATWAALHESGVHATLAGVALGLMTPVKPLVDEGRLAGFLDWARPHTDNPERDGRIVPPRLAQAVREAMSPQERLEKELHPWSAFVVLPLFALANAGIVFGAAEPFAPITIAVFAGLALGKPLGIALFAWAASASGLAKKPADVTWTMLAGAGMLAGIGFTMALFIAQIAFSGSALQSAKLGVFGASLAAAAAGMFVLRRLAPKAKARP